MLERASILKASVTLRCGVCGNVLKVVGDRLLYCGRCSNLVRAYLD